MCDIIHTFGHAGLSALGSKKLNAAVSSCNAKCNLQNIKKNCHANWWIVTILTTKSKRLLHFTKRVMYHSLMYMLYECYLSLHLGGWAFDTNCVLHALPKRPYLPNIHCIYNFNIMYTHGLAHISSSRTIRCYLTKCSFLHSFACLTKENVNLFHDFNFVLFCLVCGKNSPVFIQKCHRFVLLWVFVKGICIFCELEYCSVGVGWWRSCMLRMLCTCAMRMNIRSCLCLNYIKKFVCLCLSGCMD